MKVVEQLIIDERILKDFKMKSEKNRLDVIRSLGKKFCPVDL